MKKLKLFFALFAMLALGVTNAWAEETTLDFSALYSADTDVSSTEFKVVDGISLKFAKGNGSTAPKYYSSSTSVRLYAKGTMTISSTIGNITGITLAYGTSDKTNAITTDCGTFSSPNWTGNSSSVIFTIDGTSGHRRIKAVTVTYTPSSGGGETPDPGTGEGGEEPETPGTGSSTGWVETAIANIASSDLVVVTMTSSSGTYAMSNDKETGTAPAAVKVTVNGDKLSEEPADNLKWNISYSSGSLTIYPNGDSSKWLYCTNTNNGTRVGTNTNKTFTIDGTYLKHTGTNRYVGVYNNQDWRCYTSSSTNIGSQTLKFYKYVAPSSGDEPETPTPSVSVSPASHTFATTNVGETATQVFEITAENTTETLSAEISNTTDYDISAIADNKITVTYQPQTAGTHEATLTIKAGEEASTTVALTGKAKTPLEPIAGGVIDILNQDWTDVTGTNYTDVAAKTAENEGHSNAQYVAQCAGDKSSIQLRSNNNNSGVVSTISGGIVKRVEVEWQNETTAGRILQVYGSNTAYEAATDLYSDDKKGELLGEITMGGDETVVDYSQWTGDYKYIGLRSKSGAMYLTTITITWLPINSKVTIDDAIQNGSISVSGAADLNAVAAGTELTLSNSPATGYKLTAYDVYKTDDATTKVTVTDGKFIMPEFDVTISATFELAKTLTGVEITNAATQTTFWQGETFNSTGLKVTAHFDGAAGEDVTSKITVTGSTATAGTQTVTVSYKEGATTETATYNITVKAIPNTKETAYTVADAFDIIDKLTTAEGVFIKGIVSQVDEYFSNYKSITYWISDDGTTTKQLQAYSGKGLDGAEFSDINGVSKADQVIVCGDLKKHTDGTYEFNYNNYLVSQIKTTKADPELSYTTTEYNVNLGDAFTAPTLNNPHTLAITYSSNNEDVATVGTDGAVTIKAAGSVTITASFAGDENYVAGEVSYTINITDPNQLEATFDAKVDLGNTTRGEGEITKSPITFACSDGVLGNGSEYRLYQDANITFAAENGYAITKVVLTSTASGDSQYGPAKLSAEDGTYTYSGKEGTWVGEAYTVTLTAIAQTRATLITVYYKQDNRADAGLVWNPATVSLTIGDAFTAPTFSNPNSVTGITFTSDNTALATVNNAGEISLVSGKTGSATITATYAGNETYKPAEVKCTITVNPKTEIVVILAQYNSKWYALKNVEETADKVLAALPVNYVGGKLYNVADADKATIEWQLAIDGTVATFKNGENYISGTAGSADMKLATTECEWTYDGSSYMIGNRTFLYRAQANGFKNYNAEDNAGTADYSALPVVTAPVYKTGTLYTIKATAENGTVIGAGIYEEGAEVTLTADPAMDYTFVSWTKGGEVVSTANPFVFEATENLDLVANFAEISPTSNTLTGEFSVGQYEVAQFATGNLQYNVKDEKWSFAKQQYQYVGEANINVGDPTFTGTIDMFGWSTNETNYGVDPRNVNEFYDGEFVDWGNIEELGDGWSTLSADQWKYLLNTRKNAENLKQIARVGSVVGIMLFPDVWTMPKDVNVTAEYDSYFGVKIYNYTLEQWAELEEAGALFLPAAGRRTGGYGNMINYDQQVETREDYLVNGGFYRWKDNTNIYCYYWTSTINESTKDVSYLHNIQALGGDKYTIGIGAVWGEKGRYGQSVRLAKVTDITPVVIRDGLTVGQWGTLCPTQNVENPTGATFYQIAYLEEKDGLPFNMHFNQITETTLTAGQPYFFIASATEIKGVKYGGVKTKGSDKNGFYGYIGETPWTLPYQESFDATSDENTFVIWNNSVFRINEETKIKSERCYININSTEPSRTSTLAPVGARRITMGVSGINGQNTATGMENVDASAQPVKTIINGQLFILRGEKMYDAQGKLVK